MKPHILRTTANSNLLYLELPTLIPYGSNSNIKVRF